MDEHNRVRFACNLRTVHLAAWNAAAALYTARDTSVSRGQQEGPRAPPTVPLASSGLFPRGLHGGSRGEGRGAWDSKAQRADGRPGSPLGVGPDESRAAEQAGSTSSQPGLKPEF